ncbi:MAG: nuclear transport factor 2 family protein [Acidobacteria bacterium]|nr:nuclear transport factor 2 family protein [Acidobacteriota bacterium]
MNNQNAVRIRAIFLFLALVLMVMSAEAQTNPDERALRELVRLENEGKQVIKFTDQSISVSGAYPGPVIGPEARKKANEEVNRNRLNQTRKNEIVRLVVSKSGDMAYEYGNFTMSFDTPEKKHVSFSGAYLRVWRKVGGEWMVEVLLARPTEPVREKPANQPR